MKRQPMERKKIFATIANITTTAPINKNLPKLEKSFFALLPIADITKNIKAVPPPASAIISPPLENPNATCKMRESIKPIKNVKPSNNATPTPLFLYFWIPNIKPKEIPKNNNTESNGEFGKNAN